MKTALILEGGAKRGIYTAGVLDVFLENVIMPDAVFGVSAGAIHGCSYTAGQKERSIRYNLRYGNDPRFMSLKNWLKTGNVVDTEFCYHELPDKLDPFDHDSFEKAAAKFYAVCSNLVTGEAEYILCPSLRDNRIDYLRASASLPFLSRIVEIDGKKLLDGGICDSIPLKAAQDLGFSRNIVILTRPEGYRKKPAHNGWLARLVYRKYPAFAAAIARRHIMYNQELDYVVEQEKLGQALVLRPSRLIKIGKMETDLGIVRQMYELGRQDATARLAEIKAFLARQQDGTGES